ncbi:aspartate/glutamate racemase family protein [Criblamydia sequanensis]|uniref:Aspartate racemase n=1 Tax=Candidatus Criblamydia sequanensis CRIB-18 TaxID=1437425 RepID=A0A090D322_9BACT|nr:aspartate/glutamate racemase family protein [Criblamydia sequanensis]CDR34853.1 Putative aspartate racemase [Criblamydia sequanensis CRIB-18]
MKPKIIGIVGGAGPFAGLRLFERLLFLSSRQYGCYKDGDYPQVLLNSFPFSDMLTDKKNPKLLKTELTLSLNQLRAQGAEVLAIACNTLHNFLEEDQEQEDLIHLPNLLGEELRLDEVPLVLCTRTSRENKLHKKFFECRYPELSLQEKVDGIIDRILQGESRSIARDLLWVIERGKAEAVILGCTELSLFSGELASSTKKVIDPLEMLAKKMLERSFKENQKAPA